MPIITRKRSIRSRLGEVLLAPILAPLGLLLLGSPVILLAIPIMIFTVWMSGEPLSNLLPSRHTWFILGMSFAFIGAISILLSLRDVLTTGRFERVWIPDPECQEATWQFVERILNKDFEGAFSALTPETHSQESLEALRNVEQSIREGRESPPVIERVSEIVIAPSYEANGQLDWPQDGDAATQVRFASAESEIRDSSALTVHWNLRNGEYRVAWFGFLPFPACDLDEDTFT